MQPRYLFSENGQTIVASRMVLEIMQAFGKTAYDIAERIAVTGATDYSEDSIRFHSEDGNPSGYLWIRLQDHQIMTIFSYKKTLMMTAEGLRISVPDTLKVAIVRHQPSLKEVVTLPQGINPPIRKWEGYHGFSAVIGKYKRSYLTTLPVDFDWPIPTSTPDGDAT